MEGRMYESQQQHLVDLQDSSGFGSDPKSWLSGAGDDLSRTLSSLSAAAATASATGSVDPVLFNDLVEMVPLVQSLIDRKSNSSFTRRGSMIYTKTPSREALYKKAAGRSATLPTKKSRDQGDRNAPNSQDMEDLSVISSRTLLSEKDSEELMALRDQVEDLKRQISEKDVLLESAELLKNELASIQKKYEELKSEAAEKDSLIKSTQLQLSDAKVKLADKQAAVEKLQWEAMTSNKKVERLQEDLDKVQGEISSFMLLIEGLTGNDTAISPGGSGSCKGGLYHCCGGCKRSAKRRIYFCCCKSKVSSAVTSSATILTASTRTTPHFEALFSETYVYSCCMSRKMIGRA